MTLAQASSPPPRRELDKEDNSPCAISLRWDPLRLSETFARSKRGFGRLSNDSRRKPWASLCSSRLGEASSLGRDNQCSPLLAPAQHIHTYQTETPDNPISHGSTQTQGINETTLVQVKIAPYKEVLASFTWNELVLMPWHRTTEYHSSRRRSQSWKKWTKGVYYWSSNTTHGNRTRDLEVWVGNTYVSQEWSQAERELKVRLGTLAKATPTLREGDMFLRKWAQVRVWAL